MFPLMGQFGLPATLSPVAGLGLRQQSAIGNTPASLLTTASSLPVSRFTLGGNPFGVQAGFGAQQQNMLLLTMMMQMMQNMTQMFQLVLSQFQGGGGIMQPGTPIPTIPIPGIPTTPIPTTPIPTTPIGNPPATGTASPPLTQDDLVNFVLAGSQGGRTQTDELIDGRFANPNSRFANAGANEFDAVIVKAYAAQFKSYALGVDVVFTPGKSPQTIANNIAIGQATRMVPEAELLAQVAATYRGDFGGASVYNNRALQGLLASWGRTDLANQPLVGIADVQSVGSVIKALNEQPDPSIRQAWLQQIFDFQNNTPSSPSGAVPNLRQYQIAISMVKSGTIDQLVNNYFNGVKTSGTINVTIPDTPVTNPPTTTPPNNNAPVLATPDINRNIAFRGLSTDVRTQAGLNDRDRAILHLWGRQVISRGFQDGGIYFNVLQTEPNRFTAAERQLIQELANREQATFGGVTGKELDREFFLLMQRMHPGETINAERWFNTPARASQGPINIVSDLGTLQQRTGLSALDQAVLRLWGHEPLLNGGKIDGSILAYTIGNPNALDSAANAANGGQNVNIDPIAQLLLEQDFASDGVRNGDSLRFAFGRVLDKIYLGAAGPTVDSLNANTQQKAVQNGRTIQQIGRDVQQGVVQAMSEAASMVKNHPVMTAASIGGMAAATAICPFLGGMALGGVGIAAGQAFLNNQQNQANASTTL